MNEIDLNNKLSELNKLFNLIWQKKNVVITNLYSVCVCVCNVFFPSGLAVESNFSIVAQQINRK